MRKLYNAFFYIPKYGKVREKVMLARVTVTIMIMVVCLAAMSIIACAYFSYNVTSDSNIIKAANFEANISINITHSNNEAVMATKNGNIQVVNLAAGTYTVELTKGESTAKTGFCVIAIGDTDYYTSQIGVDVEKGQTDASVTFTVKVSENTRMETLSHWGTSSYYGYAGISSNTLFIENGAVIDLTTSITDIEEISSSEGQGTTDGTTTPENTPSNATENTETIGAPTTEADE